MNRKHARWVLLGLLIAGIVPAVAMADTEDGGSGLSRVEEAYALPIGRPLFNFSLGYYSESQDSLIEARYMTLTPSLTLGLGMGFEASLGIPLDGLTTTEGVGEYDRRIDLRASEATAKVRYTGNFFTPRVRFGVQALADLPFGGMDRTGSTKEPDRGYDPGILGLLSVNFGPYDVPMRLHANYGYWQSRNDGAVYFRDYPGPITGFGDDFNVDDNDMYIAGLAFEAGFRGATLFAELTGEYLAEARDQMAVSEGYWRFTPGVRFKLSSTIAMTAALSADVSSDDSETVFNPDDMYPETEFQLGLSLGRVFGQERYESDYRAKEMQKKKDAEELALAQAAAAAAAASRLSGTPVEASAIRAEMGRDSTVALTPAATVAPTYVAPAPMTNEQRMIEMEYRLRFLEMNMKINELEQRMRWMSATPMYPVPAARDTTGLRGENTGGSPSATPASLAAAETAPATTGPTAQDALVVAQAEEISRLRRELNQSSTPPPSARQGATTTVTQPNDDDDNTAAAVAAGMVAGAAIAKSGNDEAQPATTTPAPTGTAPTGAAATGTAAAGAATTMTAAGSFAYPETPGTRSLLVTPKGDATQPLLSDADTKAALDRLAADLKAYPETQVLVLVHGAGTDAAASLKYTEDQAGMVQDYLTLAGCGATQVQVLGLGTSEPPAGASAPAARLEVARIK